MKAGVSTEGRRMESPLMRQETFGEVADHANVKESNRFKQRKGRSVFDSPHRIQTFRPKKGHSKDVAGTSSFAIAPSMSPLANKSVGGKALNTPRSDLINK